MIGDRTFIRCSCGFEGSSEIQDKDEEIRKASVICPECMRIHIIEKMTKGGEK